MYTDVRLTCQGKADGPVYGTWDLQSAQWEQKHKAMDSPMESMPNRQCPKNTTANRWDNAPAMPQATVGNDKAVSDPSDPRSWPRPHLGSKFSSHFPSGSAAGCPYPDIRLQDAPSFQVDSWEDEKLTVKFHSWEHLPMYIPSFCIDRLDDVSGTRQMARRRYEQTGRWFAQKHGLDKVFHRLDRVFVLEANFQNQYRKAVQEAAEIAVERLQYCMLSDDRSQYCIRRQWYRPGRKTTIDTDGWTLLS